MFSVGETVKSLALSKANKYATPTCESRSYKELQWKGHEIFCAHEKNVLQQLVLEAQRTADKCIV